MSAQTEAIASSRYVIGIDLGTSNSALSYIDTLAIHPQSTVLPISQLESPGVTFTSEVLPSFLYLPPVEEPGLRIPEIEEHTDEKPGKFVLGNYAREITATLPGRVIHSAKSWLCHTAVDREEKILPWASEEIESANRLSPIETSAKYLAYLKAAWNSSVGKHHPDYEFSKQSIIITVPASFDEAAQLLTLRAAALAGFPADIRLLEEPQAAFYFWLESHAVSGALQEAILAQLPALKENMQTVLVCDIGGGTTDFSLFEMSPPRSATALPLIKRIRVSDHILLGGDNLDLALAHRLEPGFQGPNQKLSTRQWNRLIAISRGLKEKVLQNGPEAENAAEVFSISLAGEGSGLFAKALSTSVDRDSIRKTILEGFFPWAQADEKPRQATTGLREWGLPFTSETRITRHLAGFLAGKEIHAVLFTGGTLKPRFLQTRLLEQLTRWQGGTAPVQLENPEMDLAVARGAAFYGSLLRKSSARGTPRIRGGYRHAVFVELFDKDEKGQAQLLCLIPKGFEAGDAANIRELAFRLLVDRPVRFQLYSSNRRTGDKSGELVAWNAEEFHPLPPLQTQLTLKPGLVKPANGLIDIGLEASVNETGLLQLSCIHTRTDHTEDRWQLDFNLRKKLSGSESSEGSSDSESRSAETGLSPDRLKRAVDAIEIYFGKKKSEDTKENPKGLRKELEKIIALPMEDWNLALSRALWGALSPGVTRRQRSQGHELSFLQLAGVCLRPGYGADLDPWRMSELWRCFGIGMAFPKQTPNVTQWWIMWRRVAGGLDGNQQKQLIARLVPTILGRQETAAEILLLVGALERLDSETKVSMGDVFVRKLVERKVVAVDQHLWALGRIANRSPLYAGAQAALAPRAVESWVEKLVTLEPEGKGLPLLNFFLSQACRMTRDRTLDVSETTRTLALNKLDRNGATDEQKKVVREYIEIDRTAQAQLFGETLPSGLRLA